MENQQNQQSSTSGKDKQSPNPFAKLHEIYQLAVELRATFTPYRMIQEEIKAQFSKSFKEQTIRTWFLKDGACYEALEYITKQRTIEREKDFALMKDKLNETAISAVGVIEKAIAGGKVTELQVAAAKDILDRTGFPKQTKTTFSGNIKSTSLDKVTEALRAIASGQKLPIQKEENIIEGTTVNG